MKNEEKLIESGRIVNTHGVRGEVRITPWADSAAFLRRFSVFYIDEQPVRVVSSRVHKSQLIAKLEGVDTPEAAEKLRNKLLYMHRDDLELDEGTYFIQDLIGLEVRDADSDKVYGKITDVMQTGANDVYVIKGDEREYLVPAIADVIISTDVDEGFMTIRPLDGLFD